MLKVYRCVIVDIIPPFLVGLIVLTFVVMAQQIGKFSELLLAPNVTAPKILKMAVCLLPSVLIFTLPMSFLVGVVVGFSRLSSDNEIVAMKAGGYSVYQMLSPALLLASIVWLTTSALSLVALPYANNTLRILAYDVGLSQLIINVRPRVFNEDLPNLVLYVEDLSPDRAYWRGVFLAESDGENEQRIILAKRGYLLVDASRNRVQIHLEDGLSYKVNLQEAGKDNVSRFRAAEIPVAIPKESFPRPPEKRREDMTIRELLALAGGGRTEEERNALLEIHMRFSLPFAAFVFALVGLPLGMTTKKGGRGSGFIISILVVIIYYNLLFGGKRLAALGEIPTLLGGWGANLILGALGLMLLAHTDRGAELAGLRSIKATTDLNARPSSWQQLRALESALLQLESKLAKLSAAMSRFRLMRITSTYIARGFIIYFLLSLSACVSLFIIFTLFELLDDIVRNRIGIGLVVSYFWYLMPHILMLVVPIAALLGTLIIFSVLEKTSQVTAFKAGGISVYRLSLPVLLLAALISLGLYVLQEYVLPYANQRQDNIRHIIKGRPPQTAYRPERKWIFGSENRLYNYAFFDAKENVFAKFSAFELKLRDQELLARVFAERASWNKERGWLLENGWIRIFRPLRAAAASRLQPDQIVFRRFESERFDFPEEASYFKEELLDPKETSKMTYLRLRNYIGSLSKAGFDVAQLKVELHKKIAFPLTAFVMALLAIPFSFSMGKRGAFHGITIGVLIGISYWGTQSLFEALGNYGLLSPWLAAWAPNGLYALAGLYLLTTVKT